jgi:hypothetical protein
MSLGVWSGDVGGQGMGPAHPVFAFVLLTPLSFDGGRSVTGSRNITINVTDQILTSVLPIFNCFMFAYVTVLKIHYFLVAQIIYNIYI